jgi:hypothetical protein
MYRARFVLLVALVFIPRVTWPQGDPLGPEFRVNTFTTGPQGGSGFGYDCPCQTGSSIAADGEGNFVVVWHSGENQDGSGFGIFGQRYAGDGTALGSEFRVSTYTTDGQMYPAVTTDSAGNFVVAWHSFAQDGSGSGIFGQRYSSSGLPVGPEFPVNSYTTGSQLWPSVAADPAGNFVVVWENGTTNFGIFGQRYSNSGMPLGPEFRVNTYGAGQGYPSVTADSTGNFVVVWNSFQDGSQSGVFGQRYAASGSPLGGEFRVNTFTTGNQRYPSVATASLGNFVVVWNSYAQDGSGQGIFGQRYANSGTPLGSEFRVNTYTTGWQYRPDLVADASGNFVVVWSSGGPQDPTGGVFGQRYGSSGIPLGSEFRVNTYTTNAQTHASVAADTGSLGNFVVVWESSEQDGSSWGIFGQRYGQIVPVELMHFAVE